MSRITSARHQLDHVLLGLAVFVVGVLYERTHRYHHGSVNR